MGLALLPWERLPAYILGPLLCLVSILALAKDDHLTFWHGALAVFNACFGVWLVWRRYTTGIEPLWTEEQRSKSETGKSKDAP